MWFLPCHLSLSPPTLTKQKRHYFVYLCSGYVWGGSNKTYGLLIHFYVFKILESVDLHGK